MGPVVAASGVDELPGALQALPAPAASTASADATTRQVVEVVYADVDPVLWPAAELSAIDAAEIAAVLGQDPGHPLMAAFAAALRDAGEHIEREHGGRFVAVIEAANGSAVALADLIGAVIDSHTSL